MKPKLTEKDLADLISQITKDREKSKEGFHRSEGALSVCQFLIDKFEFDKTEIQKQSETV